jgi:uncharacterized membrane protein
MILRRLSQIFFVALLAFTALPSFVLAAEESIREFNTEIVVNTDGTIDVTERILYDFGDNSRHGIFRDITLSRETTDGVKSIQVADIGVTDGDGNSQPFSEPYKSGYKEIKIGDPDIFVSGLKNYEISYTVYGAIGYFEDYDEIYWNTTGNEWIVPIESASARVTLPKLFKNEELKISCYAGGYGNNGPCFKSGPIFGANELTNQFEFSKDLLSSGEGMTVAVGFPKGFVSQPSKFIFIMLFIYSYPLVFLPFLTIIIMTYIWYKHGRDPKGDPVIIPEYDVPFNLTPLQLAGILNQRIKSSDISAEIIYLATKGFIKVTHIEKTGFFSSDDYQLDLLKSYSDIPDGATGLFKFDHMLIDALFSNTKTVKISGLKNNFYAHIDPIVKRVFSSLVSAGYYPKSPKDIHDMSLVSIFIILFLWIGFFASLNLSINFLFVAVSLVIIFLFSRIMPKKTELGMKAYDKILGLRDYLQIAEKDRLKFNNAPERTPERFEKLLPYAMALQVEETWSKEFKDIYLQSPTWYSDTGNRGFDVMYFGSSLHNFRNESAGVMSSTPSSSGSDGGGFSGGGGGGVGGGSW